ncbi:MAG: PAS domain S-box protein [Acidobacteria bacterium]|nr:PAS domain S-box protein [Acidobacteriota bacterium]
MSQLSATAQSGNPAALIASFCRASRSFFQVDGVYFWQSTASGELMGLEADGWRAEQFRGRRLKLGEAALVTEAVQKRQPVFSNQPGQIAGEVNEPGARAVLAVPLVVSNEVLGSAAFVYSATPGSFNEEMAAQATILTGQLGSLLEANRLTQAAQVEHRRAEILAEVAQVLHCLPDVAAVMEAMADRLRNLLRTRLVCVLLGEGNEVRLQAVGADSPQLAAAVRSRYEHRGLSFATDLALRVAAVGEPITVAIDPARHALGELVPPGSLLAAPLRTAHATGVVLVYPRQEGPFSAEEKSLLSAVASLGAVAIANAELYTTARAQAEELHGLLEITAELGAIGNLNGFLQGFVQRAGGFLGFDRVFVGLLEKGIFQVRWGAERGQPEAIEQAFPEGAATRALLRKEPFWTDDPTTVPGANLEMVRKFRVRQILAVPLLGADGKVLGMFGALDKNDQKPIAREDVRRARSLAGQVALALEATRNLELAQQSRARADALMQLAQALNSRLQVPDCAGEITARVTEMMQARGGMLAVRREGALEAVALQGSALSGEQRTLVLKRLGAALGEFRAKHGDAPAVLAQPAKDIFGEALAGQLGWTDGLLVSLIGPSRELVGVLCLADRAQPLTPEDEPLLLAIAGHASIALENACLFSRVEQSNRHWIEIFDAITDFIVVHDGADKVLRVNRSLADFIGVAPAALLGVQMGALLTMGRSLPVSRCPFCHDDGGNFGEYVHPVLDRSYLVSTSRVSAEGKDDFQTIHVLKDISDRREAERRYRELFDNIQEGLFFCTVGGRFVEVNDALVRMLGHTGREELLQLDVRQQVFLEVGQYERFAAGMREHGAVRNQEESLRRRDGSVVQVLINAVAVRDAQGEITQYRGVMLDISGLKSFQAELQRERDFSGKILNNTQSFILVADTAGLISYANRRWSEGGYRQEALLGHPLMELASAARRTALQEAFAATLEGQQVDNLEMQIVRSDGRLGQFSVNLSPMRDEQGAVSSVVAVMSDVTDAALLRAKLMHAEKMAAVGQLVSGVAHEVNNPLTAILGFADLLMENPELPETARKDLRVILQEAQRTKQIVQNLLSFARQMPPQRVPVQLNVILRRTVQLRAYDLQNHGVEVVEHLDQELPQVMGDSHQLQQVFLNILNNAYDAMQHTGRPGQIEITTARVGSFAEVSFRDNGQGIVQPDRIFDPFFTTKDVGKGTGLGLSICYGIVREHGGEISCHNNSGRAGATFIVRLPAVPEKASLGAAVGVKP